MTLDVNVPKKVLRKTEFKEVVNVKGDPCKNIITDPEEWDNVLFLGNDPGYGDVFKAWDNGGNHFILYFGEKGDEFND